MKMQKLVATVAMAGAITAGTAGVAYAADDSGATSGKPAATAAKHPRLRHGDPSPGRQDRRRHPRREQRRTCGPR